MSLQIAAREGQLIVDRTHCHGCQSCMIACSLVHEGRSVPSWARIQVKLDPFGGLHDIRTCQQCQPALCAEACPQEAIQRTAAGYWAVDEELCVGCGACVDACPFEAIVLHPQSGLAVKCDTCEGDPACPAPGRGAAGGSRYHRLR